MALYQMEMQEESRCISKKEQMLNNRMRLLWEQHVYWTRLVISGMVFDSLDVKESTDRLLRNPEDFAQTLSLFYRESDVKEFKELFTEHLTIAASLVGEMKAGKGREAAETERKWYKNAKQISGLLASMNPNWSFREWQEMMYSHLCMTKKEAEAFISKNYAAGVEIFDCIEKEALKMADVMTRGTVRQFCF